ncbi:MAG TPA: OmpA family protein [Steroidobacter sp.]|uniref:OmpA family protein n=1 Tax=Steroidobacter sp. TaxID=1978227 RepID=UPI002EDAC839
MTRNRVTRNWNIGWLASVAIGFLCALAGVAQAAGEPGEDHPMISRYPGSKIVEYRQLQFEKIQLASGFAESPAKNKRAEPKLQAFEGKVTTTIYHLVGEQSAREVFRNYEQALARAGLKTLLNCFNETCGNRIPIALYRDNYREPLYRKMLYDSIDNSTSDFGYVSATGTSNGAPVAASVFVGRIRTGNRVYVGLDIVEGEAMKTDQIVVSLDKLTTDLREQGKVILSGIYFDTDKDVVKPESEQALQAISDYMKKNPQQNFFVVGHSDTAGSYEHNVDLSKRRAQSVVTALTSKYAVAKPRLTAVGIGPVSPAGTNANDSGRARNRRVELVLR